MVQKDCINNDCIIVFGPTAVGKSDYAIKLAKKYNGEIINADSRQIYTDFNIGTAKVTTDQMQGIEHHLLNFVSPKQEFSVAEFRQLCLDKISQIRSRGKVPIIVGGTGLYIQSILYDMSYGDTSKNNELRSKYNKLLDTHGKDYIYNLLVQKDAKRASQLHPNDTKRVIRALEILDSGNMPSKVTKRKSNIHAYVICIVMDRGKLYDRINKRVDIMIDSGLESEVRSLLDKGITFDDYCMKTIGYKEWKDYFDGNITLADTIELIKKNTRNYAKRQITWLKHSIEYNELIEL